jgi:hypothetical protein
MPALRALVVAVLVAAACLPIDNPDTYGHLAAGRQIAELGHVPSHDSFSFFRSEPAPWVDYEWLSALLFWQAYAAAGPSGLLLLELGLLALCGLLLLQVAFERRGPLAAALCAGLLLLGVPAYRMRLSVRPQLFGFVLSALYLLGLDRIAEAPDDAGGRRRAAGWIAGLALAHVAWVNLHGSNLLGLALTGAHLAAYLRRPLARRRLGLLLGLQVLAGVVSPYGPAILLDAIDHVLDPAYRELVAEWSPWRAHHPLFAMLGVLTQGLWLLLALRGLREQGPRGGAALFVCLGFALLAARSVRFVAEWMLLATPLLAAGLAPRLERLRQPAQRVVLVTGLIAVCVYAPLAAAHAPPYVAPGWGVDDREQPVLSARWLRAHHPQARVFGAMEDGWYLMFAAPGSRQLLDGRVPFYGVEHVQLVQRAFASPEAFAQVVTRFGVDAVLVQHTLAGQQPLLATLRARDDFVLVEVEDRHALFVARALAERVTAPRPAAFSLGYDVQAGLAAGRDALRRELERLPQLPNTCALRGLWRGVAALSGLEREAGAAAAARGAGFRAARTAAERQRFATAEAALGEAAGCMTLLPVLRAYQAAAALGACQLDAAERLLEALQAQGGSREALLLSQELALRRGRVAEVRAFLAEARALPAAQGDPWLAALEAELAAPVRCP